MVQSYKNFLFGQKKIELVLLFSIVFFNFAWQIYNYLTWNLGISLHAKQQTQQ